MTALGDILVDQQIPGHNHAPAGHGHTQAVVR